MRKRRLRHPEHLADRPRIDRAIERGGAGDLLRSLPAGIDTQLGRWFHKGVELSGGQWQRVALARLHARAGRHPDPR